jgi:uncharacterized membrane protein YfcA
VLLVFVGALAIGISLGLLGSGGSILTVPVLRYLVGQPDKLAIGGSLFVVGLIAAAGCIPYAIRRQVDWKSVAWFGIPGVCGAWIGASLAHWVPGAVQLALFAVVMLVAAWRMLRGAGVAGAARPPLRAAIVGGGLGVGLLSGLVGVGGGFLIVPALVLLAGVPMVNAVGTSLVVISLNSFSGFREYLDVLQHRGLALDWGVLLTVSAIGIVGSLVGQRLGRHLPQATLRRLFGVFLILMAILISVDVAPRLLG